MRILAVDDESGALRLMTEAIREAVPQAEVIGFQIPGEALEFVCHHICEVAFLDIRMGDMSGMELARRMKEKLPEINIIFATGYSEYTLDALHLHASGYVLKPVLAEDVKNELDNLLHPIRRLKPKIYVQCFGPFQLFVDGKPVSFSRRKSRELLAYLIHCRGAALSRKELAAVLFEDRPYDTATQNYFTQTVRAMVSALKSVNALDILIRRENSYAVDLHTFACDAYEYIKGSKQAEHLFQGEYMSQYEWGEGFLGDFLAGKKK